VVEGTFKYHQRVRIQKSALQFQKPVIHGGYLHTVTDLINALPGNSSVNKVQHATNEKAVFSVDPTDAPTDWLDSDHVICAYCRAMSVPRLYNESSELQVQANWN
jgi:hypothetical protein